MHSDIPTYAFVIFAIATAAGVLLQAGILLGIFLALRPLLKKVGSLVDEARVHVVPILASSRTLVDDLKPKIVGVVDDLTPKIKTVSTNVTETTSLFRREAENIKGAVDEVVGRTRGQAARVDGMVTGTLNGVEHATSTIQNGVSIPLRKISGWLAGIKAGYDVLRSKREAGNRNSETTGKTYSGRNHVTDKDLFV